MISLNTYTSEKGEIFDPFQAARQKGPPAKTPGHAPDATGDQPISMVSTNTFTAETGTPVA